MKRALSTVALGLVLCASTSAFAYDGYVTASVYLRAGPDSGYPSVARLRAGTSVVIEGCVDDWSWCDVANHDDRGWVSADYLQHDYQGHRVLVAQYGVQIGIPIITFVFGSYWDDHYRSRSWYHDRDRYSQVTPHYGHAGTSGSSQYQSSGGSHTYQAPSHQAPVGQPRQTGTATSQPSYQAKPATTSAPQQPTTQVKTQEKSAAQTRPPVEHNKAPAPEQQHGVQQHQQQQQQQHKTETPTTSQKQAPAQSKSPPAQSGKDKGSQGGKDQSKDQGGGKDQSKDQGGGKEHDKDQGGGKDEGKVSR